MQNTPSLCEVRAIGWGNDFGPISQRAIDLVENYKQACIESSAAAAGIDLPMGQAPSPEAFNEYERACKAEMSQAFACVDHWRKMRRNGVADSFYIESACSAIHTHETFAQLCVLPHYLLDAIGRGLQGNCH